MRVSRALASAALFAIIAGAARADIIDRVVAVVDGHLITMSDVRTITALHLLDPSSPASPVEAGRDPSVEHLIDRILVLEEVERYAPAPPDDKAIDARLGVIAGANGSAAQVEERLHELGVRSAWLRQWATDSMRIRAYVDQRRRRPLGQYGTGRGNLGPAPVRQRRCRAAGQSSRNRRAHWWWRSIPSGWTHSRCEWRRLARRLRWDRIQCGADG
jgi:hypothetical protein